MTERSERDGSRRDDRGGYGERGYRGGDRGYRGSSGGGGGRRYRDGDRGYRGGSGGGRGYRDGERGRSRRVYDDEPRDGLLADLVGHLHALDGRSYAAYKAIVGRYRAPAGWFLHIDRVQSDPYAPPTRIHLDVPTDLHGLELLDEADLLADADRRLAVGDFLTRELHAGFRGTALSIASPGQEILQRSSVIVRPDEKKEGTGWTLEIRARLALPAQGRSIQGHEASRIVGRDLVRELEEAMDLTGKRGDRLVRHVATLEDHRALTAEVASNGWVAFLADGSVLPRRSGVSDEPLDGGVPLQAPDSMAATVELPHAGTVRGTVVEAGVNVIVGGGYHGKSTLLSAIERGVYPHVPGDGRELVATVPDAVKVRAADGRAVTGVDLTPFISHLPAGHDTSSFTTRNASGSTSQAASIIEAVEAGATTLLLDEDTSATNLLIRDSRMRELVAAEREPITPLVDRITALFRRRGVSTVMVMGGSGDYLDVADRVLLMDAYHLRDVTEQARRVVADQPRPLTGLEDFAEPRQRVPEPAPPRTRRGPVRTRAQGTSTLVLDREDIDISDVGGVTDPGQAEAIAYALRALLEQRFDGVSPLRECLDDLEALLDDEGLDALTDERERPAFLVRPRMVDVAAAVSRYRKLELAGRRSGD
ncbi:ABC-ATPase domain-containing protein [Actinomyces oris]|uniref:ABC-ATPase domain-containing protein n=1 Tax=Actinomyces oris TaxID=544580 RepID=A0AAW9KQV8_9ACTO|nr:ABC-ATPase domain-containing protein [Actinomyces oris]MEA1305632.1 ABC-ATPase domain-containing protein [Actinomyces oris]